MAKVTRYQEFTAPDGQVHRIPYLVDEAEEARKGSDPDHDKDPDKVLASVLCSLDGHGDEDTAVHPGRKDVDALRYAVRRLAKLLQRLTAPSGIGTSPSAVDSVGLPVAAPVDEK